MGRERRIRGKDWGDQSEKRDWLSSVKPLFSTLLFFAIQEKKLKGVDDRMASYGWELRPKDRPMTFRHLADMTSGLCSPGTARRSVRVQRLCDPALSEDTVRSCFQGGPRSGRGESSSCAAVRRRIVVQPATASAGVRSRLYSYRLVLASPRPLEGRAIVEGRILPEISETRCGVFAAPHAGSRQ